MRLTLAALTLAAVLALAALWQWERAGRIAAVSRADLAEANALALEDAVRLHRAAMDRWRREAERQAADAAARSAEADALRRRVRTATPTEAARMGADALRGQP
jgi:ATP-dependent helicase YprA (DUF1998 family)